MSKLALETPGVEHAIAFPGLSIAGLTNSPNAGIVFVGLKPFEERKTKDLSGPAIAATLNKKFSQIQDAFVAVFPRRPSKAWGPSAASSCSSRSRRSRLDALYDNTQKVLGAGMKSPAARGLVLGLQVNVPQLYADLDRTRAKSQGIAVTNVFETMQAYLGSVYVNDFNRFGRTFQVTVQADAQTAPHARGHRRAPNAQCARHHGTSEHGAVGEGHQRTQIASRATTATPPPK